MIFRKPYAFLIKNFKKIHILLLLLSFYVFFKQMQVLGFVREYISLGTYSSALESIDTKIGFLLYFVLVLIIGISFLMMWLLFYKKKPWKEYLLIIAEYILMFVAFVMTKSFFDSYSVESLVSGIFAARDILVISGVFQYVVFILLIIRVLGIDLNKFSFNTDKEFLELSSRDREEFEISISIDRHSVVRTFNRLRRNVTYFYLEHRFVCNIFLTGVFVLVLGYSYYYFGIIHKSYRQNQVLNTGVYEIKVLDSYVSDKDLSGRKIEVGSKFVVVNISMKNKSGSSIEPNLDRFHLINSSIDTTYVNYYNNYFTDLGSPAGAKMSINSMKEKSFYLVFKVDEKLKNNRFVLYYQELGGKSDSYLRKIKIKLKDVSKISKTNNYLVDEDVVFEYANGDKKELKVDDCQILENANFNRYVCSVKGCGIESFPIASGGGYKILKLTFSSSDFEGVDFVDFSKKYGKIKYENSKGKKVYSDIVDLVGVSFEGKEVFFKIVDDASISKSISLVYTLRNKRYSIDIR